MILETLYLKFVSDTRDAERNLKDIKRDSDSAATSMDRLAFKSDKANFSLGKIGSSASKIGPVISRWIGLAAIISTVFNNIKSQAALSDFSQSLGLNAQTLSVWGNAVEKEGGRLEDFVQSLKNVSEKFHKTPQQIIADLPKLGEKFKNAPDIQAAERAGKELGFDEHTIALLRQGNTQLKYLIDHEAELATVTDDDAKKAKEAAIAWAQVNKEITGLTNTLVPILLPALKTLNEFLSHLTDSINLVTGAISKYLPEKNPIGNLGSPHAFDFVGNYIGKKIKDNLDKGKESRDPSKNPRLQNYYDRINASKATSLNSMSTSALTNNSKSVSNSNTVSINEIKVTSNSADLTGVSEDMVRKVMHNDYRSAMSTMEDGNKI